MALLCSSPSLASPFSDTSTSTIVSAKIGYFSSSSIAFRDDPRNFGGSMADLCVMPSSAACEGWNAVSRINDGRSLRTCASQAEGASEYVDTSKPATEDASGTRRRKRRKRVFLLDVYPLCYEGSKPSPAAFVKWMKLFFSEATHKDPVIAVMDGERGNLRRRALLPSYKAKRNSYSPLRLPANVVLGFGGEDVDLRQAFPYIRDFFHLCHIPVVKFEDSEADDVIASLMHAGSSQQGLDIVIASPDRDFRQLLADNVQLVIPLPDLHKWSFYTLQLYMAQHQCHPRIELGMRCLLGDKTDCVPGLSDLAPGFGRKTALKLMTKHGSLEALLEEAAVRTVGKASVQEALVKYASVLRRNYEVLSLKKDMDVTFEEEWCFERDASNDMLAFATLEEQLQELRQRRFHRSVLYQC